jgi:hypothetical protein
MLHGRVSAFGRFTVEDAFSYAFYCHCSRCRLRTGSAFASIGGIDVDKVQVTDGREHVLLEGERPTATARAARSATRSCSPPCAAGSTCT